MFNLFGNSKKTPIKAFNPKTDKSSPEYQDVLVRMQSWGRPQSKDTLLIQLCSLDMCLKKNDTPRKLRAYIGALKNEEYENFLNEIYGVEVCA